jgi:AbrB family looped-hinge helix DNA binding protein
MDQADKFKYNSILQVRQGEYMSLIGIRTATITEKGQIAIPKEARKLKGFEEGTKIALISFNDRIELRPLDQISDRFATALASEESLAKEWSTKEEDEAWKDL